jgi:hypothetical protein
MRRQLKNEPEIPEHFTQCVTDGIDKSDEKLDEFPSKLHSRAIRRRIKDLW